ncbi:MerR family DNA-binding transcriptional regulator, partial [Priestia megaterium]
MSIGIVKELTGLSERQIRYYEKRSLLFPDRT